MTEPWRTHAESTGCYCATQRKPCTFHEGFDTGWGTKTLGDCLNEAPRSVNIQPVFECQACGHLDHDDIDKCREPSCPCPDDGFAQ